MQFPVARVLTDTSLHLASINTRVHDLLIMCEIPYKSTCQSKGRLVTSTGSKSLGYGLWTLCSRTVMVTLVTARPPRMIPGSIVESPNAKSESSIQRRGTNPERRHPIK
jgi:hypothetical protein